MEVDPFKLYAYWELTPRDERTAKQTLGDPATETAWVLRFYDVTSIDFDGTNAHSWFDVSIDLLPGNWYVDLWVAEKTYCAELGPRASDGHFQGIVRSNFLQTSRAGVSSLYEPRMLRVEGAFETIEPVADPASPASPPPVGGGSELPLGEPAQAEAAVQEPTAVEPTADDRTTPDQARPISLSDTEIRQYYEALSTMRGQQEPRAAANTESSPSSAMPPTAVSRARPPEAASARKGSMIRPSAKGVAASVSLNVVAEAGARRAADGTWPAFVELIVSGHARPGQTLEILGRRVPIDPEGSFNVRLSLALSRASSDEFGR
jgi:hypothetical protein